MPVVNFELEGIRFLKFNLKNYVYTKSLREKRGWIY